jgi:biopolymer transport protein ExbD
MKRYSQRSGHSAMAELNVTPLLDLAFVLLIIFIITTPLLENSVTLKLPTATNHVTPPVDPKSIRTVSVDARGQVYLENQPVDLNTLQQDLIAFREQTPDAAVVVRADKSLRYQQVIDVYDVLQRAKIERMNLDTVEP